MMLTKLVNGVIRALTHVLLKIDRSELNKVPQRGPFLVVMNHVNFLDAPVIITQMVPRPITGLIKKETWDNPFMAFLFNQWQGIPIDRSLADFNAFAEAIKALDEGKILGIAPEGTRTGDGCLIRGKPGVAILASKCDVPILPIAYFGHENCKSDWRKLKRPRMTIKVGEPFKLNLGGQRRDKQVLQAATDAIMLEIARLMPEQYHGVYADIRVKREKYIKDLDLSPGEHVPQAPLKQFSHT
jgi:1-acyl-sn-glycerol-3-phosphate acyltransferase